MKPMTFNPEMEELLTDSGLLATDLIGAENITLFGQKQKGQLIGLVGLEAYGNNALLRSLVVSPSERGIDS
ncbi:MAG: hypothetical protein ACJAYF_002672 [Arenicella sp.]|jgi:hypothetical protein